MLQAVKAGPFLVFKGGCMNGIFSHILLILISSTCFTVTRSAKYKSEGIQKIYWIKVRIMKSEWMITPVPQLLELHS